MMFCRTCGYKNNDVEMFCVQCERSLYPPFTKKEDFKPIYYGTQSWRVPTKLPAFDPELYEFKWSDHT